jgi:hypothetical protein
MTIFRSSALVVAVAALLAPVALPAQAQPRQGSGQAVLVNRFLNGGDLLALCRNDASAEQRTQCNAYILGVVEALNTEAAALHNIRLFCFKPRC